MLWTRNRRLEQCPSHFSENTIWFVKSTASKFSTCSQRKKEITSNQNVCTVENRCKKCNEKFLGKYLLLKNFTEDQVRSEILKMDRVLVDDINDVFYIHNIKKDFEVLTVGRIRYIEQKYKCHLYFYRPEADTRHNIKRKMVAVRKPHGKKFDKKIHLILSNELPQTANGIIEKFEMLHDEKLLVERYICSKTPKCSYSTLHKQNFERHTKSCGKFNVQKLSTKQVTYGVEKNIIQEMVDLQYIPECALQYENYLLCTFD